MAGTFARAFSPGENALADYLAHLKPLLGWVIYSRHLARQGRFSAVEADVHYKVMQRVACLACIEAPTLINSLVPRAAPKRRLVIVAANDQKGGIFADCITPFDVASKRPRVTRSSGFVRSTSYSAS